MVAVSTDKRNLTRLPCSMALSEHSQSGLIGEIRNISLDGGFISTSSPLPKGSVFPLVFQLSADGPSIRTEAEVVRVDGDGMGVHFLTMPSKDARRLRRYVGELTGTMGNRENAERLLDVDSRVTQPITDPAKIQAILQAGAGPKIFTILPATRLLREQLELVPSDDACLRMKSSTRTSLVPGEDALVLHTHDYVSYFFRTKVLYVDDKEVEIEVPSELKYSERRSAKREQNADDATVKFSVPWRKNAMVTWNVVERTKGGLSFRADPKDAFFWPGTELENVVYVQGGKEEPLTRVVVKHLTTMDEDSEPWLRVGVAFGATRQVSAVTTETGSSSQKVDTFWFRVLTRLHRFVSALEFLYHTRFRNALAKADNAPFVLVKFNNAFGKALVGMLNTSFMEPDRKNVRAPLVIITPGFGVRKETLSALALTLTHNFRRQHRDIAVLRVDGTNNLGESEKNPGCEGEGKHCLQWTISDGIADVLGALTWAKNNRHVDPTDVVIISVSIGSAAARRVLTMPEGAVVSHWVAFHGTPDVGNTLMHAAGNIDLFGNYKRGIKTGVISLMGCLGDADNFAKDAFAIHSGTLDDAKHDMEKIRAAVTWVVGKHDAYVDARRVHELMAVNSAGDREIIEMNSGHMPRNSDEALAQFSLITRHIWRRLYGRELVADVPSHGWLAAMADREWKRVRHGMPTDTRAWWKDYLLGDNGLGFDAWALTPEYRQLIADQINLIPAGAQKVLDLGAGTGNVTKAIVARGGHEVTAVDIVPEALERLKQKVGEANLEIAVASIEGTPRIAMTRWLKGELGGLDALAARMPAAIQSDLNLISTSCTSEIWSLLRGNDIDAKGALRRAGLSESLVETARGLQMLARVCRGGYEPIPESIGPAIRDALASSGGLPFEDNTFDAIVCSIVLSYIEHPDDSLFEMRRLLKPGGTLVISSMRPDADTSKAFVNGLDLVARMPESELPPGWTRESTADAIRAFADHSAQLLRLEEEGAFHFWEGDTLARMVLQAGFADATVHYSCGDPAMAVIVKCKKQ